ncbi:MAG: TIGR00282 family metallophosphoesterase [Candidatus Sumerlaeaceae bacterium]
MPKELRVLLVGDAVGRPGRELLKKIVPRYRESARVDFVIANGENSAHGKGITTDTAKEMLDAGVDVITLGNHAWDNKDVYKIIETELRLIRPGNYGETPEVPGRGSGVFDVPGTDGIKVGVLNLLGRVHMHPVHCPFHAARTIVLQLHEQTPIVFLDFHAEATSEKIAMGWFMDGQVSCVFGTHTHVQTADERLLNEGTAYITDIGMTGGQQGVIGVKTAEVLHRFLTNLPVRHEVADEDVQLCGALVTVDVETGRAVSIERVREKE